MYSYGALDSEQALIDFVVAQKRQGLATASVNKSIASARHYCHFMGLSWELPKHQKEHSTIRRTFSDDEINKILDCDENEYSDFLKLAAHTGARPQEILALTQESYDSGTQCVVLRGFKTKHDRMIPIPGLSVDWSALPFRFCHDSANNELKRRCKKVGISYRSLYSFRHSFATRLINGDANLLAVKTLMGHDNLDTTAIYYHTSITHLRKAVERDTLNVNNMTPDQKIALLKKHIAEMVERLKLDSDQSFEVKYESESDQINLNIKVKKEKKVSR